MAAAHTNGLNAGYVAQLLEDYLDAPASVPAEWRELFERDPEAVVAALPGLSRLLAQPGSGLASAPAPRCRARSCGRAEPGRSCRARGTASRADSAPGAGDGPARPAPARRPSTGTALPGRRRPSTRRCSAGSQLRWRS